jgi:hydroxyacylglutathione hydrolase
MIFEQIRIGGDRNFAYLIGDPESKRAALVDPAHDPALALARAAELGLTVTLLINTHGHADHIGGNSHVLQHSEARLVAHGNIADGEELSLGKVTLRFIHTPGHTPDSLCLLAESAGEASRLVTGDTLFVGKVGGTGLGDDAREEYDSLHRKLMTLPGETEVWPGHDYGVRPSSSIAEELAGNPFIIQESFEAFVDLKRNWAEYKAKHGIQ